MHSAPQRMMAVVCLMSTVMAVPACLSAAVAQSQFTDVNSNWAQPFIDTLAQKNIISGFPDASFRPDQPVTRAQFAAIVRQAFSSAAASRPSRPFNDVQSGYWASPAIDYAYSTGFLSGYTDGSFQPDLAIPKVQALVAISSGLNIQPVGSTDSTLLRYYDAAQIPNYAKPGVAAATQRNIPVNYPKAAMLNPNQSATRADIAAFIYQSLVSQGRLAPIGANFPASQYIVQGGSLPATPSESGTGTLTVGAGIPVELSGAEPGANLVMTVGENVETTFIVAEDVVNTSQQVVIPEGSKIVGRFQPFEVNKTLGTQFTASKLMIGNTSYTLNASSVPIAARKKSSLSVADLTGSISTLAASAALDAAISGKVRVGSLVPGVIQTGQTIGKQIVGKSDTSNEVILVEPDQLALKLNADFEFLPGSTTALAGPSTNLYQVDSGTTVDLAAQTDNARYVMLPGETVPIELQTARSIYNSQNQVLVPEGSLIKGQIVPMTINGQEGVQFVANEIVIGTQTYPITAASAGVSSSSLQSLSPTDFQGNVIASPEASQSLRDVSNAEEESSGSDFLGLGNLLGGSRSSQKVILFNPTSLQLEFRAPLSLNEFDN